jgi:hypothetical protein
MNWIPSTIPQCEFLTHITTIKHSQTILFFTIFFLLLKSNIIDFFSLLLKFCLKITCHIHLKIIKKELLQNYY